jgi:hypothetical protein
MSKPVPSAIMSALLTGMTSLSSPEARLPCRVLAYRESIPPGLLGGYVALTGSERSLQVGLLSDILGWQSLTRVTESHETLARDEVVKAACVLVTAAARALSAELGPDALCIGLPLFVDGSVLVCPETELQAADIVLGSTRALLVLLAPRSGGAVQTDESSTPRAASVAEGRR